LSPKHANYIKMSPLKLGRYSTRASRVECKAVTQSSV